MKTILWLDDIREPNGYHSDGNTWVDCFAPIQAPFALMWVKNYNDFTKYISEYGMPTAICFDHDLGIVNHEKRLSQGMSKRQSRKLKVEDKSGYDCAKWLVDYCIDNNKEIPLYGIQSMNPVGKENIKCLLENFKKHCKK